MNSPSKLPTIGSLVNIILSVTVDAALVNAQNFITNGDFELPVIAGRYTIFQAIPGWETTFGSGIEVQRDAARLPYRGAQLVELDSRSNSGMRQQVKITPGRPYRLTFAYSPRPGVSAESNGIEAYFNNSLVVSITASGVEFSSARWTILTNIVAAPTNSSFLEFRATGASSSTGGYIDDVRLEPLAGPILRIRCASADCSEIELCWDTLANYRYHVQYCSELIPDSWRNLGGQVLGDGTTQCVRDAVASGEARKFYRIVME